MLELAPSIHKAATDLRPRFLRTTRCYAPLFLVGVVPNDADREKHLRGDEVSAPWSVATLALCSF